MTTAPSTTRLRGLTLTLTERCNMRCGYCYVPKERARVMAPETVDAAVDLLLRHGQGGRKSSLFFFGGEPLLEPELLLRAADRFRSLAPAGLETDVGVTTNGTLLDDEWLRRCRGGPVRVALSVDGDEGQGGERRLADGGELGESLRDRLEGIFELEPEVEVTARMTVTPTNVDRLAAKVQALARAGARHIVFLPAYELPWDDDAIAAWGREHERLGTWLAGAHGAGRRPPDLPVWRGVEERLLGGKPRRHCGAGSRLAAVTTDGTVMPCYRFVFAADAEDLALGHVDSGLTNDDVRALFAALDPAALHPEEGECKSCSAQDGCNHFCPALGHLMLRDLAGVPASVCRLTRAAVEAIRPFASLDPRAPAPRRKWSGWARAAAIATAAVASVGAASCRGGGGDDSDADTPMGGVCPFQADAGDDDADVPMGGVCPVESDGGRDDADVPMGGVCPVEVDGGRDDADVPMGGVCPVEVDAGRDDADTPMGGICPVEVDAGRDDADTPMGGIC